MHISIHDIQSLHLGDIYFADSIFIFFWSHKSVSALPTNHQIFNSFLYHVTILTNIVFYNQIVHLSSGKQDGSEK